MSERGSFTTQYIYNDADARIVRKALDRKSKYLCISPPATWSNGAETFSMPIISGKVGGLDSGDEWREIFEMFEDIKTEKPVAAVVMCDDAKIVLVAKTPKGNVAAFKLSITEELDYTPGLFEEVQDGRA
jgi:hypothetical protein